jgi:hypothetical protein
MIHSHARRAFPLFALVVALLAVSALPVLGVTTSKPYTAVVGPDPVASGTTVDFKLTLTNLSGSQQLGSANLTVPTGSGFTMSNADDPAGAATATVTNAGTLLQLRNLAIPPTGSNSRDYTFDLSVASTACGADWNWILAVKQSNDFNGTGNDFFLKTTGSDLTTTVTCIQTATALRFFTQPAGAEKTAVISSVAFNTDGVTNPIQVEVIDSSGNRVTSSTASISMAIGNDPNQSEVPPQTAVLTGTNPVSAVNGVASFTNLKIDKSGTGYTIVASSTGLTSVTSNAFNVVDDAAACSGTCNASATVPNLNIQASGTSTGGFLLLSVGGAPLSCGDSYNHLPDTVTIDQFNYDGQGNKVVTLRVSKQFDQSQPNNGVSFYEICYERPASAGPFPTLNGGTSTCDANVCFGLLPDPCGAAPCIQKKSKNKAGDVLITLLLPPGDPKAH